MSNYHGSKNVKLMWEIFWLGQILLGHPVKSVPLFYLEHQKSNDKSLWLLIHSTQEMSSWKTSARLLNKQ